MRITPIAFAFDNNLILPACICISSLMMNSNENTFYDIFIIHSNKIDLHKNDLERIPSYFKNCRIQYRTIDNFFDKAFEIRNITTAAYYRLLIPELIPEYDKIIYSDVDVIFRNDLSDIFHNTNLDQYYIAGVNSLSYLIPGLNDYYYKLKLDSHRIIYSGNIIINSKRILDDKLLSKFKSLAKNNYRFQDMDVLNIACQNNIFYLPISFCLTTYLSQWYIYEKKELLKYWSEEEINNAEKNSIIHYNGAKPWKQFCINYDIWWEYYRKSPFFNSKFYFDFYNNKLDELDKLPLLKRIKILARYFFIK